VAVPHRRATGSVAHRITAAPSVHRPQYDQVGRRADTNRTAAATTARSQRRGQPVAFSPIRPTARTTAA
jgi:hypothetical protein